jgi:hypothetical protein
MNRQHAVEGASVRKSFILVLAVALMMMAACGSPSTETAGGGGGDEGAPSSGGVDPYTPSTDPDQPVSNQDPDHCEDDPYSRDSEGTEDPDDYQSFAPCEDPGSNLKDRPYRLVEPRPGMEDLHPVSWEEAKVVGGGDTVLLTFHSGVEPCYVLDHATVVEDDKEIRITLYEGNDPKRRGAACIEIAVLKAVKVTLEEPVGDRKIVDGAGG